jgi:hypothetical protein
MDSPMTPIQSRVLGALNDEWRTAREISILARESRWQTPWALRKLSNAGLVEVLRDPELEALRYRRVENPNEKQAAA